MYLIQKFHAAQPIQVVYLDGKTKNHFVKRFVIETSTIGKKFIFISEEKGSKLECASTANPTLVEFLTETKKGEKKKEEITINDFMDIKGWKSVGNRLSQEIIKKVILISDKVGQFDVPQEENIEEEEIESDDSNTDSGNENEGVKATPTPPPMPIQKGDNPQLDLL